MRKITSKEDEEKKRKRNQLIVGFILAFVMIVSTLGFAFQSQDTSNTNSGKIKYNDYEFLNQNGLWHTTLGNYQFAFAYNPNQVEKINSQVNLLNNYVAEPIYISSQSYDSESEIYRNLDQIVLRRQYACLENETCLDKNFPIKTCEDNFIIIEESNVSEITQRQNCVFIKGKLENLPKITDEFLFKILGIEK
ncbi:MAG: hypothetical protein AABW51_00290 [Nanoarchaeota archaeon]